MSLQELRNKRNQLMNEASRLIHGENVTAETRALFDKMIADSDLIQEDIVREERIAAFQQEQRAATRPHREQPGAGSVDPEKRSLLEWMRSGNTERRDLGVGAVAGNITGGSQLVAPAFYPILTEAQLAYGGVVNIVNQRRTETGASMKVALVNDTANGLQSWPEDTAASNVDPAINSAQSNTEMYHTGAVFVTLEELQDSFFDIDAFLGKQLFQRLYRGLAKNVSKGTTSGNFVSYFATATSGATSGTPTAVTYQDLAALSASLDPAYKANATWTFNSNTLGTLIATVDSLGRPLFIPNPSSGAFDTLLGRPVVLDQYAPDIAAGATAVAFGDFKSGYTLRSVGDFQIARDPYTYLLSKGSVAFIGYGRGGSFATDAGTHPIKVLTQHA